MPFKYFGKINFTPYTKVDKFADYLQKGKLMGTKCKKCGERYFPPRAACLKCLTDTTEWIEYSGVLKIREGGKTLPQGDSETISLAKKVMSVSLTI